MKKVRLNTFWLLLIYLSLESVIFELSKIIFGISILQRSLYNVADIIIAVLIFGLYKRKVLTGLFKSKFIWVLGLGSILVGSILKYSIPISVSHLVGQSNSAKEILQQQKDLMMFNIRSINIFQLLYLIIFTGFLTPLYEELFFRGVIFQRLNNKYNIYIAIIISSLFFAIVHTTGWFIFLTSFIFGSILCLIFNKSRNISYNIIIHSTFNLISIILLYGNFIGKIIHI